MSCVVCLWWRTALVCPCGQARVSPACAPPLLSMLLLLPKAELSGTETRRMKQVCISAASSIDFSERVINSRADFRRCYTSRKVGAEIGPFPSCSSERDVKQSTADGAVLRTRHKPVVCLQGCEQEPWSRCHFWQACFSFNLQSQTHVDLHGCWRTRSSGYFIAGHLFLTAEESDL